MGAVVKSEDVAAGLEEGGGTTDWILHRLH